jgi:FtsP/CotA-like multicopper oxidase with cupredoxin domain
MSRPEISRRRALLLGSAAVAIGAVGWTVATSGPGFAATPRPLQIPPLDPGVMQDGVRVYDLTVQRGETEFFTDVKTETLGINGTYLGPVLRMTSGETVRMNVRNSLAEQTTLHWHGFTLPARMDGGPHQVVEPGTVWSPQFEVREKASTMWFHSHLLDHTAEQVWAGLAGMILIDDAESTALNLPSTYGVDDIPVVLQDRSFRRNGQMPYKPSMQSRMMGMTGDVAMVNGTILPYFEAATGLLRLRLLNGSNGSIYSLAFDDGRSFAQIASDGGLLAAPVRMNALRLAPGERAEIVVDMSQGGAAMLHGRVTGGMMGGMMGVGGGTFNFLELRPSASLAESPDLPERLADLPAASAAGVDKFRRFEMQMSGMGPFAKFLINGRAMKMDRIDEVVEVGVPEIWEVSNAGPMAHPLHIHNTQFRILDRNGALPAAAERGLKDTVVVDPGERVRILVRFDSYTDPERPYMYHCHILEHEDAGMMGQFTVV